jgi:methylated-DNA-protein-cysteine methyltransferase related protein
MGSRRHPEVNERNRQILDVLMALRPGEVTTYGDVADVSGHPRQARLVGHVLATTDVEVPWWRVVDASGRLVAHHAQLQTELLVAEGVTIEGSRVTDAPVGRFARRLGRPAQAGGSADRSC